jgi:hypothetical protein
LDNSIDINESHIAEALQFRVKSDEWNLCGSHNYLYYKISVQP